MRIIAPSATIIEDELARVSVYRRIDRCASVYYQRLPGLTDEQARAFCKKLMARGHWSALEFAIVHLLVECETAAEQVEKEKHLFGSPLSDAAGPTIVSGSIRAFMEAESNGILQHIREHLAGHYPLFFTETPREHSGIRFASDREIPWKHRHVAVRFIVNRTISHELVRHRPCSILQESQQFCRYGSEVTFIGPEWFTPGNDIASRCWQAQCASSEAAYQAILSQGKSPQQAQAVLSNSTKTELVLYASLPEWRHIFMLRCAHAAGNEMRRVMEPLLERFMERYPEMFTAYRSTEQLALAV